MSRSSATRGSLPDRSSPRLLGTLLLALGAIALGSQSTFGAGFGIAFAAGAVALGAYLRYRGGRYRFLGLALPLPALLVTSGWTSISVLTELLAGAAGLLYLLWLAEEALESRESTRNVFRVLALPALALGIAVTSSWLVPISSLLIGGATALLVVLLIGVGWLFEHPEVLRSGASGS
jgi:hypothetical protein